MKYKAYLPISASAEFEFETDEELTGDELVEAFLTHSRPVSSSLCHQCSNHIETDCDAVVGESFNLKAEDIYTDD